MENMKNTLAKWGFTLVKEAPRTEPEPREPRDLFRDVERVKQLLAEGITAEMILSHPHIKLTAEARAYLEKL